MWVITWNKNFISKRLAFKITAWNLKLDFNPRWTSMLAFILFLFLTANAMLMEIRFGLSKFLHICPLKGCLWLMIFLIWDQTPIDRIENIIIFPLNLNAVLSFVIFSLRFFFLAFYKYMKHFGSVRMTFESFFLTNIKDIKCISCKV